MKKKLKGFINSIIYYFYIHERYILNKKFARLFELSDGSYEMLLALIVLENKEIDKITNKYNKLWLLE